MSWDFDNSGGNTNRRFRGVSTGTYTLPLSFGCYTKVANKISSDVPMAWASDFTSDTDSMHLSPQSDDDRYRVHSIDSSSTQATASYLAPTGTYDGIWMPEVGIVTSNTLRDIYIALLANKGSNTSFKSLESVLFDSMNIGTRADGPQVYLGLIAEVFFYNGDLSSDNSGVDLTDYLENGLRPSAFVGAANVVGYYSLSTNDATPDNEGAGDGPSLVQTGTGTIVFDADHPTMNDGVSGNPHYYYAQQ